MTETQPPASVPQGGERWAFICEASSCRFSGSVATREALAQALPAAAPGAVALKVVRTGCLGLCGAGPAVVTYPEGEVHLHVQPADAADLAASLSGSGQRGRRQVRAPAWYREHITARLETLVQLLRRRAAGPLA